MRAPCAPARILRLLKDMGTRGLQTFVSMYAEGASFERITKISVELDVSMQNMAELIKQRVSVRDAVEMYLPGTKIRNNRIPCPIHDGSDYNLSFRDGFFKCFVCGIGGDVITFVRYVLKTDFVSAMETLNRDFALGLPIGRKATLTERKAIERKVGELRSKKREEEYRKKREEQLWDKWIEYDKAVRELCPRDMTQEIDEKYIEAVKNINYVEYLIESGDYCEQPAF